MHVHVHLHTTSPLRALPHTKLHTHTHKHTHTHTRTHTHNLHTHIHTHTHRCCHDLTAAKCGALVSHCWCHMSPGHALEVLRMMQVGRVGWCAPF